MLRQVDGRLACKRCGVVLAVPDDSKPDVAFLTEPGRKPIRLVSIDGIEVHRCVVITRRLTRNERTWKDWPE